MLGSLKVHCLELGQAKFTNKQIDVSLIKESLSDLLSIQSRQVSIDNIQKIVTDYYNIKLSDLLSNKRNRSLARPRQLSMSLAKETQHITSLK